MMRYLKQYKFLLFLTVLFTAISSLSYVFIAILLQQVMDIVDMGDMDGFIRILLFSLAYFALMGVFMYLQSLFSKIFVCKIMKAVRSKTFMGIEKHTIEDYSKNNTADYLSAITNDVKMIEDNFFTSSLASHSIHDYFHSVPCCNDLLRHYRYGMRNYCNRHYAYRPQSVRRTAL